MFKVGDTVKVIKNDSRSSNMVGDVGTITEIDSYNNVKVTVDGRSNYSNFHYPHDLEHFGPVRETIIVKKEIVPGVYGKVVVRTWEADTVFDCSISMSHTNKKAELAEAIKTLQIIHDVME